MPAYQTLMRVFSYIRYLLQARDWHSVHSPFVFGLIEHALRPGPGLPAYAPAEKTRRALMGSRQSLLVTDYGSGGLKRRQYVKKVSVIARNSGKDKKAGRMLHRLAQYFSPAVVLELGTSLGIGTLYLRTATPGADLHTLEGCPATAALAAKNFEQTGFGDIRVHTGPFDETLPALLASGLRPDFVFIDGNHLLEPTLRYFELLLQYSGPETVMIFDDIHWSKGMEEAWRQITSHPSVRVSIDLFQMGLVFFNPGLSPEKFILRV